MGEWLDKTINAIDCSVFLDTLDLVLEPVTLAILGVGQLRAASVGMSKCISAIY